MLQARCYQQPALDTSTPADHHVPLSAASHPCESAVLDHCLCCRHKAVSIATACFPVVSHFVPCCYALFYAHQIQPAPVLQVALVFTLCHRLLF